MPHATKHGKTKEEKEVVDENENQDDSAVDDATKAKDFQKGMIEKMKQLQRQMDSLTRPLGKFQTDYAALTKNLSAALDFPAIRNINKISNATDETNEDTPFIPKAN